MIIALLKPPGNGTEFNGRKACTFRNAFAYNRIRRKFRTAWRDTQLRLPGGWSPAQRHNLGCQWVGDRTFPHADPAATQSCSFTNGRNCPSASLSRAGLSPRKAVRETDAGSCLGVGAVGVNCTGRLDPLVIGLSVKPQVSGLKRTVPAALRPPGGGSDNRRPSNRHKRNQRVLFLAACPIAFLLLFCCKDCRGCRSAIGL